MVLQIASHYGEIGRKSWSIKKDTNFRENQQYIPFSKGVGNGQKLGKKKKLLGLLPMPILWIIIHKLDFSSVSGLKLGMKLSGSFAQQFSNTTIGQGGVMYDTMRETQVIGLKRPGSVIHETTTNACQNNFSRTNNPKVIFLTMPLLEKRMYMFSNRF